MSYVRSQATRAVFHAFRMIKSLDVLSGHRYPMLYPVLEKHSPDRSRRNWSKKRRSAPGSGPALFRRSPRRWWIGWGARAPTWGSPKPPAPAHPPGICHHHPRPYEAFLAHNDLVDEINKRKTGASISMTWKPSGRPAKKSRDDHLGPASPRIWKRPSWRPMPGWPEPLAPRAGGLLPRVSLRSSAIGEDSELSFAGQYLTAAERDRGQPLPEPISMSGQPLYPPGHLLPPDQGHPGRRHRHERGLPADGRLQGQRRHVFPPSLRLLEDNIIINAVWGLGPYAVDGDHHPGYLHGRQGCEI